MNTYSRCRILNHKFSWNFSKTKAPGIHLVHSSGEFGSRIHKLARRTHEPTVLYCVKIQKFQAALDWSLRFDHRFADADCRDPLACVAIGFARTKGARPRICWAGSRGTDR